MLVLSRKVGERIHVGNDIYIEVRRVAGSRVTVAISAPKSVRILRGELLEASRAFDVLDDVTTDATVETSEATIDTVIMSGQEAAAALPSDAVSPSEIDQPSVPTEPSETVG